MTDELVKAWQDLNDHIGEKNASFPRWKIPQCSRCSFLDCCEGIDNLRTPIVKDGVIVDYEPGCKHFEAVR